MELLDRADRLERNAKRISTEHDRRALQLQLEGLGTPSHIAGQPEGHDLASAILAAGWDRITQPVVTVGRRPRSGWRRRRGVWTAT